MAEGSPLVPAVGPDERDAAYQADRKMARAIEGDPNSTEKRNANGTLLSGATAEPADQTPWYQRWGQNVVDAGRYISAWSNYEDPDIGREYRQSPEYQQLAATPGAQAVSNTFTGIAHGAQQFGAGLQTTAQGLGDTGKVISAWTNNEDPEAGKQFRTTPEYHQAVNNAAQFWTNTGKGLIAPLQWFANQGIAADPTNSDEARQEARDANRQTEAAVVKPVVDEYKQGGAFQAGGYVLFGIFKTAAEVAVTKRLAGPAAAEPVGPAAVEAETPVVAAPLTAGEPISVATGEYLETWRDFVIPAVVDLDGARHMGLKMPMAWRWRNPLGACQISAFDEYVANPVPGELDFYQADGRAIRFRRPFNFLASHNSAYPHLELKAPELGRLRLRDRQILKYFREYGDRFYRLEKIEDLNGNTLVFQRDENGVLERIESSDSLSLAFANDAECRRLSITLIGTDDTRQELARYAYDQRGRMVSADCAFGMSVRYEWHASKPLLMRWHNLTRRSETRFTYDEDGRVVHTATSGLWNDDRFRYDRQNLETTYLPAGVEERAQRFAYDEHENITAEIDALGGTVSHRYDEAGFRIATVDANGHESRTTYDTRGNIRHFTDAEGRSTVYGWGPHGDIDTVIDGAGGVRKFRNDGKGNVVVAVDAEKNETHFERDERGRVVRTIFPDGTDEARSYDDYGRLATIRDAKGGRTLLAYDAFGRLIETTDALGGTTRFAYAAGAGGFAAPTSLTRPDGVTVHRAFDAEGSLASVSDGEGRRWSYRFGAFEVLQAITDPKGGQLSFSYDSEGRLTAVKNAMGEVYELVRDIAGRVVEEVDFDGRVTRYRRDTGGRVIETVKPDGARLVYGYDKTDKVTRIESFAPGARSEAEPEDITRFWYDGRGLIEKAENGAALIEYRRDKNGAVIGEALNGRWVESRLDAMGRRIERRIPGSSPGSEGLVSYAHDPLGLIEKLAIGDHAPLAFTRDALGRETRRAVTAGFRLDSAYDAAGQLLHQTGGHGVSGMASETLVRQMGLSEQAGGQIDRRYRWDRASSPLAIADSLWGETSFAYDANGQVEEASFNGELIECFGYDAARNVAGAGVTGSGTMFGLKEAIGKVQAWSSTPGGVVQAARGPHGERLSLTHDAAGRVIERRVERDGFRPRVWRYGWDGHDHLVKCITPQGETWRYGYDPFGRRMWKVREFSPEEARQHSRHLAGASGAARSGPLRPGESEQSPTVGIHYLWDGDVLAEEAPFRLDGSVDWVQAIRWHYEPGSFRPLAKETPDGTLLYVVTDHLGTPREMVDERGDVRWAASYTTWGVVRGIRAVVPSAANDDRALGWTLGGGGQRTTYGNLALKPAPEDSPQAYDCPIRFQGQWQDEETGLYYNRYRHYDPLAGQYVSPDPIGLTGGDRPQGYVINPTVWNDPLGLDARAAYQRPPPTASANWNTARSQYWKSTAESELADPSGKYSTANIAEMAKGRSPKMTVIVRNRKTGQITQQDVSVELHHRTLVQRGGSAYANESWNLEPAAPWSHEGMDQFRNTGYDLIKIIKGPNSW